MEKVKEVRIVLMNTPEHTNIGDHLITIAEYAFFQKFLPSYEIVEITSKAYLEKKEAIKGKLSKSDIIVITGGGFLGSLWESGKNVLDIVENYPDNRIIIFPQSIFFEEDEKGNALKEKTKRLFCGHPNLFVCFRERFSFDTAAFLFKGKVKQFLVPDMALLLDKKYPQKERKGILLCLRNDKESILSVEEKKEIYRLLIKKTSIIDETSMHWNEEFDFKNREKFVDEKLEELKAYSLVITDTLHCMISCFISQTPCIAFNNLTKKVEGVYKYCLDKFFFIKFCENINEFPLCADDMIKRQEHELFNKDMFLSQYRLLAEIITDKCELRIEAAIIIEDKLYITADNTPGVVYIYNMSERKIEEKFVLPFLGAILCSYEHELWIIPKKSRQIIIYNILEKTNEILPLEFFDNRIFETSYSSIFPKPVQNGEILWLSCSLGLIKINMKKRTYRFYSYLEAGFKKYNMAYTLQLAGTKIYMFGENGFIFDLEKETMQQWRGGTNLLYGFVDDDRVLSIEDNKIKITDMDGKEIHNENLSLEDFSTKTNTVEYWRIFKCDNLCFFFTNNMARMIVYNTESKCFNAWKFKDIITNVLRYKTDFLFICSAISTIFRYDASGSLIGMYKLDILFNENWDLIESHNYMTLCSQRSDCELEEWINKLSRNKIVEWKNREPGLTFTCARDVWDDMNTYLKG